MTNQRERIVYIFISFLFLTTLTINAQEENATFEHITIKDGLSQSTVNDIIQDKNGFLWFATFGGLNKYDGYSFTVYRHDKDDSTSITIDGINYLTEDDNGFIWLEFNGQVGVDKFNPGTEKSINYQHNPSDANSLSSNDINRIYKDKLGNIWVMASNALNLVVEKEVKGKIITQFKKYLLPTESTINYAFENKFGQLMFFGDSLYFFDREADALYSTGEELPEGAVVTSVVEDDSGNLILGTTLLGIFKMQYSQVNASYEVIGAGKLNVTPSNRNYVYTDSKNNIWIGTESKGIFKYIPDKDLLVNFSPDKLDDKSLSDNTIYSIFEDHSGILWIGTFSQGLDKNDLYKKEFDHYRSIPGKKNSLSGDVISSIHTIDPRELWVGLDLDGGVNRILFNENKEPEYIHYKNDSTNPNSIPANSTLSLVQRKNGDVWIGSAGGTVTRIVPEEPGSGNQPQITSYSFSLWTFTLFEDSQGNLWGGTWQGGFWRYDDATDEFVTYYHDPKDPSTIGVEIIWAIGEDQYNNIWIGGNQKGISILPAREKMKPDANFINFAFSKEDTLSLSSNTINAFYLDHSGTMWIGTGGGLDKAIDVDSKLKNPDHSLKLNFISYHEKDGLPSETVVGIVEDNNGNLWMSTSNGVSKFNIAETTFLNYFESDGLQSNEFWHNAYFKDPNGRVYFGGQNGFNAFYPENIKENPFDPIIVFTDFKLFNKPVKVNEEVNKEIVLTKPIYNTESLSLSHKNNVFTIEFAALHYTYPLKNKYAYYLEGFDEDWNFIENQRSATFTNLNRGSYTFYVKGTNSDGRWSEEIASLSIRVRPSWWNTWLFRIIVLILVAYAAYFIVKARNKRIKHEKQLLQEQVEAGEKELLQRRLEVENQKKEIQEKEAAAMETNWYNNGMTIISDVISKYSKNIAQLTRNVIIALADYLEVDMAAIYVIEGSDQESQTLKLMGGYAIDNNRVNAAVTVHEGYLGACYNEKKNIIIDNLPENYAKLESGLGSYSMKNLVLVPMMLDDKVNGIIELASIKKVHDYKIPLIEKIGENLASSIELAQMNDRMQTIIEQLELRSEELNNQKEEMQQNMEEMLATQEEKERINHENQLREKELMDDLKDMKQKYAELKKQLR